MEYIGQKHLKDSITSIYNKGACILIGPDRYGKTYFAQQVAHNLNLQYVLVESNVDNTKALIQDIEPGNLYHLKDLHKAKQQVISRLLKLLEDNIPKGAVILITTESSNTIDTILSRCLVLKCKKYKIDELKQYKDENEIIYKIYDSPSKLNDINIDLNKVVELVDIYLEDPVNAKIGPLTDFDIEIVADVLISRLNNKKNYKVIELIEKIKRSSINNEFISNWQVVGLMLEDIRYDIV